MAVTIAAVTEQETEEDEKEYILVRICVKDRKLYLSRSLKFHPCNMDKWIEAMQLRDGMKLFEVGCAGGLLCHRLKEQLPEADITGLDLRMIFSMSAIPTQ